MNSREGRRPITKKYLFLLLWLVVVALASPVIALTESDTIPREDFPSVFAPPLEIPAPSLGAISVTGSDSGAGGIEQSGDEGEGGRFSLTSPNGVLYDMDRGLALAQGGVGFTYRDFEVRSDRGVVDYNKNQALLTGNLTVTARGRVFHGKTLTFDLDTGRWTLTQLETTFPPDFFPPGTVLEPIYVRNGTVTGTDDIAGGSNFRISSCDRDHYYIQSKRLDFYRDARGEPSRIVLHSNALYAFKKKILPLPVYVVSLTGARSRRIGLQPVVGQNESDGFFAKTVVDLAATERRTDSLLVDLLQKRGLGLGLQRELANGAGLFYLYMLSGRTGGREIDSRINHTWQITPTLNSILSFTSTQNNPYGGEGVQSTNGDLQFNFNKPNIQTSLFMRYADTSSNFSSFKSVGSTFQHHQNFGNNWTLDANSLYSGSRTSGFSNSSTLDNTFAIANSSKLLDLFLRTELHDDLVGTTQRHGAYQLERLPELGFTSDTSRLGVPFLRNALPGDIRFSYGNFNEPQTISTSRTSLGYTAHQQDFQVLRLGALKTVFSTQGNFDQAFYGNNTARYNYDYNFGVKNTIGGLSTLLNYYKQKPLGYTPFQFDFLTPSEYVDSTLSYAVADKFRLNLTGGRDIQNKFTRDVDARVQWVPSPSFYASLGATYSPESKTFGDVIGNFRLARNQNHTFGGTIDLGLRYSPQQNKFSRINSSIDLLATKKTRVEALTGYNGITRQFDFNQIRVTQDLHCFNLYATYDNTLHELRFDLALKAFPFVDTRYGVGQFGQGFDPRIGNFQ